MHRSIKLLALIVTLTIALLSAGCNLPLLRPPMACDQVYDARLDHVPFASLTQQTLVEWVKANFGLGDADLYKPVFQDGTVGLQWKAEGRKYSAYISNHSQVGMHWNTTNPTFDEVIGCLGAPNHYQAERTPNSGTVNNFSLYLWYPAKGLVVGGSSGSASFNGRMTANYLAVVKPAPYDQMLLAAHMAGSWPVLQNSTSLKPWPGKLEDVVVGTNLVPK